MNSRLIGVLQSFYHFAMLFCFIANINIGPITTRRIIILIAIVTIALRWNNNKLLYNPRRSLMGQAMFLLFGCLVITVYHSIGAISSDFYVYFTPMYLITTIFSIFVMGIWCLFEFKTFERFAKLIVAVMVLQSLFTYVSAVYQPFRIFVAEHFMTESYVERSQGAIYGMGGRAAGVGIAWSSGSLILAYGCFMLVALKKASEIKMLWFSLFYAIIIGATALMGRTGLVFEIVLIVYYGISTGKIKNVISIGAVAVVSLSLLSYILTLYDTNVAESQQKWMLEFTEMEKYEVLNNAIVDDGFPAFSYDFIFGTGLIRGHYQGYNFTADSGYVRSYTSIGIVGMFCYYIGVLLLILSAMTKSTPKNMKKLIWVGIIALYIGEYKEPFIGMTVDPWLLFTLGLFLNRKDLVKKYENSCSRRLCASK